MERIVHPLAPFYREDSEILILGSFPSVKTREMGFFYGHPQNRFWKVLAAVFGESEAQTLSAKKDFLLRHKIALYDVIKECDIRGSSDASIRNAQPTDLRGLLDTSHITRIFTNGQCAGKLYRQYQEPLLQKKARVLPSTSPANARWTLPMLIEAWQVIRSNDL